MFFSHRTKLLIREMFHVYKIQHFLLAEVVLILFAASFTPFLEHGADNARITTFGNSLWWALVTVTSTGYGDYFPVTFGGRIIGVILMFSGISLFSTMVALVASFYAHKRILRDSFKVHQALEGVQEKIIAMDKKVDFVIKNNLHSKPE